MGWGSSVGVVGGAGVEAPLIPDNILSIGLRRWQETNSQAWQKPGMRYKEVVSHTPSENPLPPSTTAPPLPLHSPILSPLKDVFVG